jgi:hypothetical protein
MIGQNIKIVNPPGDSWMSLAANPFAKKASSPLLLISPDYFLVWVSIIPKALYGSLSEMRSLTKGFILGLDLLQSLAKSRLKSFAASGVRRDSIDFFLSSFVSLFRWEP